MGLKHKDLISINQLSVEEIQEILTLARQMRDQVRSMKQTEDLRGVTVVNLFYENSTRTRSSFELAAKYQGANVLNISASSSSVQKGEGLIDTAQTINAYYPDVIVMRIQTAALMNCCPSTSTRTSSTPATGCTSIQRRRFWIS